MTSPPVRSLLLFGFLLIACGDTAIRSNPITVSADRSTPTDSGNDSTVRDAPATLPESDGVRFDTVGTHVVVRNPARGAWATGKPWQVVERFRIGVADGPEELLFSGPLIRASLSPRGHIVVLDPQADDVRIFDGKGAFIRSFGGHGNGPGELTSPTALVWVDDNTLWVANAFNGRYTVFDSTGALIRTVPRPIRGIAGRHQLLHVSGLLIRGQVQPGRVSFASVAAAK